MMSVLFTSKNGEVFLPDPADEETKDHLKNSAACRKMILEDQRENSYVYMGDLTILKNSKKHFRKPRINMFHS